MAEAEDVIIDVARHATVFAQDLWRRHRAPAGTSAIPGLQDFAQRIDLLIAAVFGTSYPIRIAQAPAPPSLLTKLLRKNDTPQLRQAVPATDGIGIWLPPSCGDADRDTALERYRTAALQQAMRAQRGSAQYQDEAAGPLLQDAYLLMEANAADEALARSLPGTAASIDRLRRHALSARPPLDAFASHRLPFERRVRALLESRCGRAPADFPPCASPAESMAAARLLLERIERESAVPLPSSGRPLLRDWWTGDLRTPPSGLGGSSESSAPQTDNGDSDSDTPQPKSARLARRPDVRRAEAGEDDERQGAFMIQTSQPHEHAEDPAGLQRPSDRDEETSADDFAESLADLPEARLVVTPGRPKEFLLSEDAPQTGCRRAEPAPGESTASLSYPEWDYRTAAYREPGATVHLLQPALGPQQWIDETLAAHRCLCDAIRRRFEILRAEPVRLRKQIDGEELDLESYVEGHADFHAGLPMAQALYQTQRRARRSMAIMLLVDVSGSTDAWVGANRRVIDVEREALLLVCLALESMGEPYSVQAFSGEGPQAVSVRSIKRFDESYGNPIARRIAALEPEQYTRSGAAIRHATTLLMAERATHRLLLLLSDGKPNDVDVYEGRYGVEDTRQAVTEARLQGVFPFCLTVDRQANSYMPAIFGPRQYGLLPRPELLPMVLLEWMKRLVSA